MADKPGLSYTGEADAPSAAVEDNTQYIGSGNVSMKVGPKGALTPSAAIAMDPTQTAELLANMQDMIAQRTGPMQQFIGGLKDASAWGGGGVQGPTQSLALRDAQKQKEEQEVFNMRSQMGALKSASAQDATLREQLGSMGGAGGAGGYSIPSEIQAAMNLERTGEGKKKIFTDWAKENAKAYAQPDMDKPTVPVLKFDQGNNEWVPDMVSPRQYRTGSYKDTPQTASALQHPSISTGDPLAAIQNGVYRQESSAGAAKTDQPNYAGAIGPMQLLPDTFNILKSEGLISKTADINNPQDNKDAGNALLAKYYKKYNGDVDKTLAAYYAGEGAINKDGSINTDWKDLKNSKAPTVGEYISLAKQKAGLAAAGQTPAPSGMPARPVSIQQAQQAQEVRMQGQKEEAKITAEASRKEQELFKANTDPGTIRTQIGLVDRFDKVLNNINASPNKDRIVGILNNPTMTNAIVGLLSEGISTPVGSVGMPGLEDALRKVTPGMKKEDIEAVQDLKQIMSSYALEASKAATGQGSMSDYERRMFKDIAGSTSNSYDMLRRTQQILQAHTQFNKDTRRLYDSLYQQGKQRDFQGFLASREFADFNDKYENKLLEINKGLVRDPARSKLIEDSDKSASTPKAPTSGTTSGKINWSVVPK